MWYKNKNTGKVWDIRDKDILKRISGDSEYEPYEPEEEIPFVPEEEIEESEPEEVEVVEEVEEEVEEAPKKAGGRRGTAAAKTKK